MNQDIATLSIPAKVIQELRKLGLNYVKSVNHDDSKVSHVIDPKTWEEATKVPIIQSSLDCYEQECLLGNILTFNQELDDALGGGITLGQITEFCGEPGSGKTQLCFQLCINVQLPTWCGGSDGKAIYICSNNNFAKHRLKEFAQYSVDRYNLIRNLKPNDKNISYSKELDSDVMLQNVYFYRCIDYVELYALIIFLKNWMESHKKIRLVVIDSISLPFRELEHRERNQALYKFLSDLQILSHKFKFAIILTNELTTRFGSTGIAFTTASLGSSYYHRINTRVELSKSSSGVLRAEIIKSIISPNVIVNFKLPC